MLATVPALASSIVAGSEGTLAMADESF